MVGEVWPWIEYNVRDITVRELILGVARAIGILNDDDDEHDGPCSKKKIENCRALYGDYFEATCELCPDRRTNE